MFVAWKLILSVYNINVLFFAFVKAVNFTFDQSLKTVGNINGRIKIVFSYKTCCILYKQFKDMVFNYI